MGDEYFQIKVNLDEVALIAAKMRYQSGVDLEQVCQETGFTREQILREFEEPSVIMRIKGSNGETSHRI